MDAYGNMRFLPEHPQCHTYKVTKLSEHVVPNILGENIPKAGSNDPEYHCATMFTLFKS